MQSEQVTFPSQGASCSGVLYRPESANGSPSAVVVLAHGMSATRLTQYDRRARRLVEAGVAVLDFDPRFIGTSAGEPRQKIDPFESLADLRAAVAYARGRADLDRSRVGLYGSSLGGGEAFVLAGEDPGLAAVALDVPMLDGLRATPAPVRARPALMAAIARDAVGRRRGRPPLVLPMIGERGSGAVLQHDGDGFWAAMDETERLEGIEWVEPRRVARHPETGEWRNEATALELLNSIRFRPVRRAAQIRCPVLAHLAEDDRVVPYRPTRRVLDKVASAEARTLRGGHFAPFWGDGFETTVRAQVEFFAHHLGAAR